MRPADCLVRRISLPRSPAETTVWCCVAPTGGGVGRTAMLAPRCDSAVMTSPSDGSVRPPSTADTHCWDRPTAAARSACCQPLRRRRDRMHRLRRPGVDSPTVSAAFAGADSDASKPWVTNPSIAGLRLCVTSGVRAPVLGGIQSGGMSSSRAWRAKASFGDRGSDSATARMQSMAPRTRSSGATSAFAAIWSR